MTALFIISLGFISQINRYFNLLFFEFFQLVLLYFATKYYSLVFENHAENLFIT